MLSKALAVLAILAALLLGVLLGSILRIARTPVSPMILVEDRRPLIPVVRIDGAEDGHIVGSVHGDVRVFLGDRVVVPNASGSFRVPGRNLLKDVTTVRIPSGMRFVASKRGKKYYPVASASAAKLAPANRVYFRDTASAEHAGFSADE